MHLDTHENLIWRGHAQADVSSLEACSWICWTFVSMPVSIHTLQVDTFTFCIERFSTVISFFLGTKLFIFSLQVKNISLDEVANGCLFLNLGGYGEFIFIFELHGHAKKISLL
jgi:hypothetical protein